MGALLAAASLLAAPITARAATITFTIQNPSGVGQAGTAAQLWSTGQSWWANGYGQATVGGLIPGDQLRFTRDPTGNAIGCPAPEGSGVVYTVPATPPAAATITLPSSSFAPAEAWVSASERGMVGLINQARANAGAGPVQISSVLSNAADGYSNYRGQTGATGHCALGSATSRSTDAGYPTKANGSGIGENIWYGGDGSAHDTFDGWMASAGHRANLLNPSYAVIGVGRVNDQWTTVFAPPCSAACERAGLTGDYGDPSLADGGPKDDGGPGSECIGLTGKALKKCKAKAIKKCKRKRNKKARKRCIRQVKANLE